MKRISVISLLTAFLISVSFVGTASGDSISDSPSSTTTKNGMFSSIISFDHRTENRNFRTMPLHLQHIC